MVAQAVWRSDDGEAFLLAVAASVPAWQRDGLCIEHPEVEFFPEKGQSLRPAKALCSRCIVQSECLAFALREQIAEGVWGGASAKERAELARRGVTADAVERWGMHAVAGAKHEREQAAFNAWLDGVCKRFANGPVSTEHNLA
jgi:WhiB family redox-sensing transcriptional regulator